MYSEKSIKVGYSYNTMYRGLNPSLSVCSGTFLLLPLAVELILDSDTYYHICSENI